MNRLVSSFIAGLIFAIGLGVSGMTNANKIVDFLNVAGDWDPSLAFVMVGAIGVHLTLYRLILRRESPLFCTQFHLPTRRDIDPHLVKGAAIFGAGWGLGGVCPGPGLTSLASVTPEAIVFVAFMLGGKALQMFVYREDRSADVIEEAPC